jgi:hypothetical protein
MDLGIDDQHGPSAQNPSRIASRAK